MSRDKVLFERLESRDGQPCQCETVPVNQQSSRRGELIWTQKQAKAALFGCVTLLLASICISLSSLLHSKQPSSPSAIECAKQNSPYSPLWEAVEFWEGDFENQFNHTSIYRGPPTLKREQAWEDLWLVNLIGVDPAGIAALNQTNSGEKIEVIGSNPANPTYGATPEVFHQLHCLNVLRQYTWPLRMYDESWGRLYPSHLKHRVGSRMHVDHCIETLRLSLMCYSDITPVFLLYDDSLPYGKADFNVHHKCRNFHKIAGYMRENGRKVRMNVNAIKQ